MRQYCKLGLGPAFPIPSASPKAQGCKARAASGVGAAVRLARHGGAANGRGGRSLAGFLVVCIAGLGLKGFARAVIGGRSLAIPAVPLSASRAGTGIAPSRAPNGQRRRLF